ncbi:hypothetical protein GGR54DRAFT_636246 [Hypoxylon sp. NC1633]|nr:hypothetical protein GGR54DRAFT_636246 [Hypoxylon sp. NC1633]
MLFRLQLTSVAAAWALGPLAAAHVILESPKPFRFIDYGPTNPLSSTGSDFPCKIPPGATLEPVGEPRVMAIGEEQAVSFSGQAVHGGGSCQFALSGPVSNGSWADYPLKNADWKVFHSIEGGCPARHQKGNLDGPNQDKYSVTIPQGIEPGDYVFSWTWFPRIGGQPEIYQNCAPVTITPAKAKRMSTSDRRELLLERAPYPGLFMANMGEVSGGCTTGEALRNQIPIAFPDPGPSVDRPEGTANLFEQPCDGNPRARKDQNQSEGPAGTSTPPQPSSTPVLGLAPSPSLTTPTDSTPPAVPTTSQVPQSSQTSEPGAVPTSNAGTCIEGHLTCLDDGTHFATCTGGQLTAPQPIAPGFKCRVGSGVGLDISPA